MSSTRNPFAWRMPATLSTTTGPRLAAYPAPLTVPGNPAEALAVASRLDQQADFLLSEGRTGQAERLAHLALEVRCRATRCRA